MISIIVEDRCIVINGVDARASDDRVSSLLAPDVRAVQFREDKGIGHIEFAYEYGDDRIPNKSITASDIDIPAIKNLHATFLAEEIERKEEEERKAREQERLEREEELRQHAIERAKLPEEERLLIEKQLRMEGEL